MTDGLPYEDEQVIRPFVLTRGRTVGALPVEAIAVSTARARREGVPRSTEHEQILAFCLAPHALAKIAAEFGLPLGVVRVLVGDLVEQGLLDVPQRASMNAEVALAERLIDGIRRL